MENMYNSIEALCTKEGISIAEMCRRVGIRQSIITDLKHGRTKNLSYNNATKIASYFNVSVDTFKEAKTNPPTLTERDKRDIARDLENIMSDLESSSNIMFDGDPMTDEAKETMKSAMKLGLEAAKLKNKERFTPKKYRNGGNWNGESND